MEPTATPAHAVPDTCDFTVFGGTGDLALRKLLPALYLRDRESQLPGDTRIIGVSRAELDDAGYRDEVRAALTTYLAPDELDPAAVERLLTRLHHVTLDVEHPDDWHQLHSLLKDRPAHEVTPRVFYLAVAPALFGSISRHLDEIGVVNERSRVVLEKPIGKDLASALAVNDAVGQVFQESQIFRIDHYLGKESVQNLLVTRFANTFLEPLWNSRWVDHVQITVAESLGVGERGGYYDHAGAMRDMVQNHLLQLLCLVAMEPPTHVGRETVRDEKLKVLQALKPMTTEDVSSETVRGRYDRGIVDGRDVASYAEDLGHDDSHTETFVALRAEVQNWRWAGVPFYLRTGKRMARRTSEIVVVFKAPPHAMFPHSEGVTEPNRLHIQVQPDEGMRLHLTAKEPGPGGIRLRPVSLDLSYATAFEQRLPDAYERLLMDVIKGNPTLFMRRDEVEAAWTWVEPILTAWATSPGRPDTYPAGSTGPDAAAALLERDGRTWQELDR
jgi:glucose-6-phosphate 1-dehydrogenase